MFKDNLMMLRKTRGMTQEELAERIDVSRQTLSKYETGESLPDVEKSRLIAEVFDVTLDELVNYEGGETRLPFPPKGKHAFGMVKVGEKGQIVIPATGNCAVKGAGFYGDGAGNAAYGDVKLRNPVRRGLQYVK